MTKAIFENEERQHSPSVLQLAEQSEREIVDFCYLSNKFFPDAEFRKELCGHFDLALHNYPSMQTEQQRLVSTLTGYKAEQIIVGNGASELIHMVAARVGEHWLMPYPSYMEYENVIRDFGKKLSLFPLYEEDNFCVDVERLLGQIKDQGVDTIVFPNPNSPTGQRLTLEALRHLLDSVGDGVNVVIDESFIEFTAEVREDIPTLRDEMDDYPQLILIRSLGKDFGVCGLRLGLMATANPAILEEIRRYVPIWNISPMAEVFLRMCVERIDDYERARVQCVRETQSFVQSLRDIPELHVFDTFSNFILFRLESGAVNSTELRDRLLGDFGFYVRDCSRKEGLSDRYIRVGTNLPKHNTALIEAISRTVLP